MMGKPNGFHSILREFLKSVRSAGLLAILLVERMMNTKMRIAHSRFGCSIGYDVDQISFTNHLRPFNHRNQRRNSYFYQDRRYTSQDKHSSKRVGSDHQQPPDDNNLRQGKLSYSAINLQVINFMFKLMPLIMIKNFGNRFSRF